MFSENAAVDLLHYQLIVETAPNGGLYESTVTHDIRNKTFRVCFLVYSSHKKSMFILKHIGRAQWFLRGHRFSGVTRDQ